MPYGYIYLTTNLINGKIYVGQHAKSKFDEKYKGSGHAILSALNKYGWDSFSCEVICWCETSEELDECEKFWISELQSNEREIGYNLCDGGQGIHGYKHTLETKNKISKNNARYWKGKVLHPNTMKACREYHMTHPSALIGRKVKPESIAKSVIGRRKHFELFGSKNKGRKISAQTREKLVESHLGQIPWNKNKTDIYTDETRKAISEGLKKYYSTHLGARTGKTFTEESKLKISKSVTLTNTGKKFITNGIKNHFLTIEQCEKYILTGEWWYGRTASEKFKEVHKYDLVGRKWIHLNNTNKFVKEKELDFYLSEGWKLGKVKK